MQYLFRSSREDKNSRVIFIGKYAVINHPFIDPGYIQVSLLIRIKPRKVIEVQNF